jgi:glycerol-3-phosphate acyltransferase PlsY
MMIAMYFVAVLIGYVLGSIPFGLLISRIRTGTDIRQVGSGKTGMTNVLRTSGKKAAALALVLDMGKGAAAVIIAGLIFETINQDYHIAQALAGLAAIAGHSWSIFLKFKGGRGVATFLGGLLAMYWPAAILSGAVMIIVAALSRYMSLGSITGAVAAAVMLIVLCILKAYPIEYAIYSLICAVFIFIMHHDNITRLINGTERKLGEKVRADTVPSPSGHK